MTSPIRVLTQARVLLAAGLLFLLAGCAPAFAPYHISSSNVVALRSAQRSAELADFTGAQANVSCRLRRIGPAGDRTFSQYIRAAFNDELVIAGAPASRERSSLSLHIKDVSVDCGNLWASWTITADVTVGSQAPVVIKVSRRFDASLLADVVQSRASQAFAPTVQQFIAAVIQHPAYQSEFGGRRDPP